MKPAEVERLRDYIEQLEGVLGVDPNSTSALRRAFPKMEPDPARMLAMLMRRDFVTRDGLYTVMYAARPECDWPDAKVIDVQFCRLRHHLDPHGITIQTVRSEGWFMSKADKAKVRLALEQAPLIDLEAVALANDQRNKRLALMEGI